jgi:hypothetical protein
MITTAQLASELRISQRAVQNRILRLGIKPQRVGLHFLLSEKQAELVRQYAKAATDAR